MCACTTKKKVSKSDVTELHKDKTEVVNHNDSDVTADIKTNTFTTIDEDETVEIEHIIYRQDTLIPAEIIRVKKTKSRNEVQQVIDSTTIALHESGGSVIQTERIDSTETKIMTETKSKSSRSLNFTIMIVLIVLLILGGLYYYIGSTRKRNR